MCDYHGCKKEAVYETQQLVGEKQYLKCCEGCAPTWVKKMKPAAWFRVRRIGGQWVNGTRENSPTKESIATKVARMKGSQNA